MGKKARIKRERQLQKGSFEKEFADRMAKNFRNELRNSEMWDQIVALYGEERAEKILRDIKAEVKPGDIG